MPTMDEFRLELRRQLEEAQRSGARPHVDINSGDFHRRVGGYPGPNHRMPVCCDVMYEEVGTGDEIISSPPKGKGASLTIRYKLPRKAN
jgi:5-methylcytosine-specific restriction protein A